MDENVMWFGTREYMQWIPCPAIEGDHSSVGWSTTAQYLNGGAFVRSSAASHRVFNLSWNLANRVDLQPLYDYAAQIYGPPPFYFIDPFAADLNVLPEWFASPGMAALDAPLLVGETRPQAITNSDTTQGYPTRGASYTVTDDLDRTPLYVPIPPGKTFWIGAHGLSNDDSALTVTPFTNSTPGTATQITNLGVSTPVRVNTSFSSNDGYTGVEISVTGEGTLSLYGIIGQILENGVGPLNGRFVGGMGHSGCQFESKPTKLAYSAAFDLIGTSATLIETEGWAH